MNNKRGSLDRILEQQNRFTSMIESSGLDRILKDQQRFTSMIESNGLNRILKDQQRFTSMIESSGLDRILEDQQRFTSMIESNGLNRILEEQQRFASIIEPNALYGILEQQNKFTSMIESSGLNQFKNIIDNINNIQSINLENIFDWNDYSEEIEDYYDDLEEICSESALDYPKNEIFFISTKNLIESIKLYFLKKVENLLKVESADYLTWKPCLDNAILKSRYSIVSNIYTLNSISNDMQICLDNENIAGQIFLCYLIVAEINIFINEIKVNFHKELKNIGIDLENS